MIIKYKKTIYTLMFVSCVEKLCKGSLLCQKTNHKSTHGLNLHCLKAPRLKEHANFNAPHHIQDSPARGSSYTCHLTVLNHTPQNPEEVIVNAHLYKGNIASPSRYDSLFTTFSTHSFSVPLLTWALECWRAYRLLSFHYEDSSSPYQSTFRHRCLSSITTGHIIWC